jgi:hypothetical protein
LPAAETLSMIVITHSNIACLAGMIALEQDAKKWEPVFRIDPALTLDERRIQMSDGITR